MSVTRFIFGLRPGSSTNGVHRLLPVGTGLAPEPVPDVAVIVAPEDRIKRALDFSLALVSLVLLSPLLALVAIAIKLDDGGAVLFRQERWARGGGTFRVLKFRSMHVRTDSRTQAVRGDPRITRVGQIIRQRAIDELPQLVNILKGEMSFVGPRALPVNERQNSGRDADLTDEQIPGFALRCSVRPGLTGIAQLYAPRDVARRFKFRYDVFYVRRRTFWLDVRLIHLTAWVTVTATAERYRGTITRRKRKGQR